MNTNSIRVKIGNVVQDVLPTTPLIGPPLPFKLGVNWPGQVILHTRPVTSKMSSVYDPVRRNILKTIRGY